MRAKIRTSHMLMLSRLKPYGKPLPRIIFMRTIVVTHQIKAVRLR
jgi:hypothetical protein